MTETAKAKWAKAPKGLRISGIGSLPHHNVDAALAYAFRFSIPFLPQIPVRNPREYMIRQALEGMPGIEAGERGEVALRLETWENECDALEKDLEVAFESAGKSAQAFEAFLPSAESYSAWRPFLWELGERKIPFAKVQLAGPMTSQWALRLSDGTPADKKPKVAMQIFRLVLARAIAMVRALKGQGVTPLFYFDEPGFYGFTRSVPRHLLGLNELKLAIQTLKQEGALVGMHCCSNTDWPSVFSLDMDVLSMDCGLSLPGLAQFPSDVSEFVKRGGVYSFGIIPTAKGGEELGEFNLKQTLDTVSKTLNACGFTKESDREAVLASSLFTPACGLALHKSEDAEKVFSLLGSVQNHLKFPA
jgi:hypothetical protein